MITAEEAKKLAACELKPVFDQVFQAIFDAAKQGHFRVVWALPYRLRGKRAWNPIMKRLVEGGFDVTSIDARLFNHVKALNIAWD